MSPPRVIIEGKDGDVAARRVRPEKGFAIVRPGGNAPAREEAAVEPGAVPDAAPAPNGGPNDGGAASDPGVADDRGGRLDVRGQIGRVEDAPHPVERAGAGGERSAARERFERSAEEIARAAEIGERAVVSHEADLFSGVEKRLPEIGDERPLAGGDPLQKPGAENADAGVEERIWSTDAEGRDAVPFGLKRRVALRLPVLDDEKRRGAAGGAVRGDEAGVVGGECGIGVDHQEVVRREKLRRIAQSAGGTEDLRLAEKRELWQARSRLAQVALDLIGEVMKINGYLADAGLMKPAQVRRRERHVEEGNERLRDALGHGTKPHAAPGAEKDRPHRAEE